MSAALRESCSFALQDLPYQRVAEGFQELRRCGPPAPSKVAEHEKLCQEFSFSMNPTGHPLPRVGGCQGFPGCKHAGEGLQSSGHLPV